MVLAFFPPSGHQPLRAAWPREKLVWERALALGFAVDDSSARSYNSATQSYLSFCKLHHFSIDPTPEVMSFYVTFMCAHISPNSVRSYLSGIAHGLESFYPQARSVTSSKLVRRTLLGCTKRRGLAVRRKRALTLDDLSLLLRSYSISPHYDDHLFLALTFISFFALLRLGEVVSSDTPALRKSRKMIRRHPLSISQDSISFFLPFHKADRLFEGSKIIVPARSDPLDPLPIFQRYLLLRDTLHRLHPMLWLREDGSSPTRSWFISRLRQHFPSDVAGHSLRSGGATAYALAGMSDDRIQALGRWSSDAFKAYIRVHPVLLQALIRGSQSFAASTH